MPRLARLALTRLGGRDTLFGNDLTVADIALASMSAPLHAAAAPVSDEPAVRELLDWGESVLGPLAEFYKRSP